MYADTRVCCIARRYFRFFGFIDSFQRMFALLGKDGFSSVAGMLELANCTCFGLYFVLEDLTTVCYLLFFVFLFLSVNRTDKELASRNGRLRSALE